MTDPSPQRWTFSQASPMGEVQASFEAAPDALRYRSDAPLGGDGPQSLAWSDVAEGCTAIVDVPGGRAGPQFARGMGGRIEWLVASRVGGGRPFMQRLPDGEARDAIVAAVRERLGARWAGEALPIQDCGERFGLSRRGDGLRVAGLVVAVLATLVVLLFVAVFAFSLLYLPALWAAGAWLFRGGLVGLRDGLTVSNTPTSRIASAAMGLVEIEGRAVCDAPSPAGVTGTPSVWWDVRVDAWYRDSDGSGGTWKQVASWHGGSGDGLVVEDDTGRVPVWLRDAKLLLEDRTWASGRDALPAAGRRLLEGAGLAWSSDRELRVRETCIEVGGPVYVLGTLDEAHRLAGAGRGALARMGLALRTGSWKRALLARLPGPLRMPVTVALSYVEMLATVGRGGDRVRTPQDAPMPALGAAEPVIWKGRGGHALLVSNRGETEALALLRKGSLWQVGLGAAGLCWALYETLTLF